MSLGIFKGPKHTSDNDVVGYVQHNSSSGFHNDTVEVLFDPYYGYNVVPETKPKEKEIDLCFCTAHIWE
jgi:hypothetical protein